MALATAPIDIPVKIKGLTDLQKLEKKVEQLERDLAKVSRTGPKAANAIKKTGRAAATATGNIQRLGVAFRTTLAPIVAITGALTLLNRALNTTGNRAAEAQVLSTGLRGLVDDSDAAANALLGVADKLGKATLFDEEDFTAQFKLLTSFRNIGVDTYERVGEAAADIATKIGTGPKEAVLQLAKALEDPARRVTDLSRSGTVFTEQQKEQIRVLQESGDLLGAQEIVLKKIEDEYGGAARAAGSAGFAGAVDSLGESWRDLLEELGKSSETGIIPFINEVTKGFAFLAKNFDQVAKLASSVIDVFVQPFVALGEEVRKVLPKVDNFEEKFRGTLAVVSKILTDVTNNVLVPVFRTAGQLIAQLVKATVGLGRTVADVASNIVSTVTGTIRVLAITITRFINATPAGLLSGLFGVDLGSGATAPLRSIADGIDGVAGSIENYGASLGAAYTAANTFQVGDVVGSLDPFAGAGPRGASEGPGGGGGGGGGSSSAVSRASQEAERLRERQRQATESIRQSLERTYQLNLRDNDLARQRLQNAYEFEDVRARINAEVASADRQELLDLAKKVELQNDFNLLKDSVTSSFENVFAEGKAIDDLIESSDKLSNVWKGIGGEVTNVLESLIQGTDDWNKTIQNTLKSLSSLLLNAGLSILGQSNQGNFLGKLFGGFRADGGPVSAGTPYVVGERGPELFVPGRSGGIVPNGAAMGGSTIVNITVNADGGGTSSSQGTKAKEAAQLGRLVESSVVSIINREKRPGGLLTR